MKKTGIARILQERTEQLEKYHYSLDSDLKYSNGELNILVQYLLKDDTDAERDELRVWLIDGTVGTKFSEAFISKLDTKTKIEQLVIAGALLAAEIDRLQHE